MSTSKASSFLQSLVAGFIGGIVALSLYNIRFDFARFFQPAPAQPAELQRMVPPQISEVMPPAPVVQSEYLNKCISEIKQHCALEFEGKGEGGVVSCLLDQEILSDECKSSLKFYVDRWQPCSEDIKKYCPGIKMGRGRLLQCMQKVKDKITNPKCAELL